MLAALISLAQILGAPATLGGTDTQQSEEGPLLRPPSARMTAAAPMEAGSPQSADTASLEREILQSVNRFRTRRGLQPLTINQKLVQVARVLCRSLMPVPALSHTDPSGRGLAQRMSAAGIPYSIAAENLYRCTGCSSPGLSAVYRWSLSPGHLSNLIDPKVTETGVGVWREGKTICVAQEFLCPPLLRRG
jgi:uncharacterized protein YkwD